jgi:curved DNA-binding protein CbpA
MSNPYGVLGVRPDATEKEITKAFRAKARTTHPDKQPPGASDAEKQRACEAFKELVAAYEVLSDKDKRFMHDLGSPDTSAARQATRPAAQRSSQQEADDYRRQRQGSARPSAASGASGERKASGRTSGWRDVGGRYVFEDDEEDESGPQRKTAQQEEDERDERRRRQQKEDDKKYEGLGSHWVKPPPKSASAPPRQQTSGAASQFRAKPMPKTKSARPADEKPKRRRRRSDGESDSDCSSDISSELSFDIHIDMSKFYFSFQPVEQEVDTLNHTEVWTIKQPVEEDTTPQEEEPSPTATDVVSKAKPKAGSSKPCCALQ